MNFDQEMDRVLHLDPNHRCYRHWKQYHLCDLARGQQIARILLSHLSLAGKVVLEIGSGIGGISIAMSRFAAKVIGIEPRGDVLQFAKLRLETTGVTNVAFVCGTAETLPFSGSVIDVVIMNDVVEHFSDPALAIRECARVLRPGGHVYVLAPNRQSFSVTLRDPHYQLPFVVWLPNRWRDLVVRKLGRGEYYDGNWFPSMGELLDAFANVGIQLATAGFFDYRMPHVAKPTLIRRLFLGYPVYLGIKSL